MISVQCRRCDQPYRLPDRAAGKKIACPNCRGVIAVPAFDGDEPVRPPRRRRTRSRRGPESGRSRRRVRRREEFDDEPWEDDFEDHEDEWEDYAPPPRRKPRRKRKKRGPQIPATMYGVLILLGVFAAVTMFTTTINGAPVYLFVVTWYGIMLPCLAQRSWVGKAMLYAQCGLGLLVMGLLLLVGLFGMAESAQAGRPMLNAETGAAMLGILIQIALLVGIVVAVESPSVRDWWKAR